MRPSRLLSSPQHVGQNSLLSLLGLGRSDQVAGCAAIVEHQLRPPSGFLLKDVPARQLVAAIRTVGEGDALLSRSITRRLIEEFSASRAPAAPAPELNELTPRELEVFRLLATGKTNGEIAAELILGETTVKTHVTRILMKLGVRDRAGSRPGLRGTRLVSPGRPTQTPRQI